MTQMCPQGSKLVKQSDNKREIPNNKIKSAFFLKKLTTFPKIPREHVARTAPNSSCIYHFHGPL